MTVENSVSRNRKDAVGDYLRQTLGDNLFCTSTGYKHVITASGREIGSANRLAEALRAFQELPESERKPAAVKSGAPGPIDQTVVPPPAPRDGLVAKIYGRMLARNTDGSLRHVHVGDFPLVQGRDDDRAGRVGYLFEAQPDYFWLTKEEADALVPAEPRAGQTQRVPEAITQRICRFHLIPARIYGEGGEWGRSAVRRAELALTVTKVSDKRIEMTLAGSAHMGSEYEAAKATTPTGPLGLGYAPTLEGVLTYDRVNKCFTRFDVVALGDAWGRMGDANGKSVSIERPGRNPLAFSFERVGPDAPVVDLGLTPAGRASKLKWYFESAK